MEFTPDTIMQMVQQFGTTFAAVMVLIWYMKKLSSNGDYGPQLDRIETKLSEQGHEINEIKTDVEILKIKVG